LGSGNFRGSDVTKRVRHGLGHADSDSGAQIIQIPILGLKSWFEAVKTSPLIGLGFRVEGSGNFKNPWFQVVQKSALAGLGFKV
jgi:hypothetical protein